MTAARVQVVIASIGLLFVIVQVRNARLAIALDHERRQKQATLEAFAALQKEHREGIRRLRAEYGRKPMSREQACLLRGDNEPVAPHGTPSAEAAFYVAAERNRLDELRDDLRTLLNEIERLAVGAQLGIYNTLVLKVQGRTILERGHARYGEYIRLVRETADKETGNVSSRAYIAFSWLIQEFSKTDPPSPDPEGKLKSYGKP